MKRFLQCCSYSLGIIYKFRGVNDNETGRKILSILCIPIALVCYLFRSLRSRYHCNGTNNICIVTMIKNEVQFISEFCNYYIALGCDVIIYDNDSSDGGKELLDKMQCCLKERNVIHELIYVPWEGKKRQVDAFNHAIRTFGRRYQYMGFFDIDEFLVAEEVLNDFSNMNLGDIVHKFFCRHSQAAALGVNWLIFGSSGHHDAVAGGVLDNYCMCAEDDFEWNELIKSIVRPERIMGWADSHLPLPLMGYSVLNFEGGGV